MITVHHLKVSSFGSEAPLQDSPDGGEGESSRWAELGAAHLLVHFACKEKWLEERVCTKSWLESGAGRSTVGKWKGLKTRSEARAL